MHDDEFLVSRKKVIVGAGIGLTTVALSACTTYGKNPAPPPAPPAPTGTPEALARTADIPVGSGVITGDIVVTQPSAGVFQAFSAVCTHAGCTVSKVANGTIDCPCHGSKFNLDGTVANGPAQDPLATENVTVQGDSVVLG